MTQWTLSIDTRTPLWTGGITTQKMDRVEESGVLGSLHWWYEAVLRGLVGAGLRPDGVCDPTGDSQHRCNWESHRWVCRACDLFGATGYARRFRLTMQGGSRLWEDGRVQITAPGGRNGWYFGPPWISTDADPIRGRILPLRGAPVANDLAVVLALISHWGGLGARTQHGLGVVDASLQDEQGRLVMPDVSAFLAPYTSGLYPDDGLPSLSNLFFARLALRNGVSAQWWRQAQLGRGATDQVWRLNAGFSVPVAPAIKYKLRYGRSGASVLPAISSSSQADQFFGTVRRNANYAAMIHVSNAYRDHQTGRWHFRVWGWFPRNVQLVGIRREDLLNQLHALVTTNQPFWDAIFGPGVVDLQQTVWREVDPTGHGRNTPGLGAATTSATDLLRVLV